MWRERYALADRDRELALLDAKTWGKRPDAVRSERTGTARVWLAPVDR
jgi:hypothetical protein